MPYQDQSNRVDSKLLQKSSSLNYPLAAPGAASVDKNYLHIN